MKILMVCKHNRFRSKVAEAIALRMGRKNEYKSAGIRLDLMRPYVCENVKKELATRGILEIDEKSRLVNEFDLRWADKIIIVANNIDKNIFDGRTGAAIEKWNIPDADESDAERIGKIVGKIERMVKMLISSANK